MFAPISFLYCCPLLLTKKSLSRSLHCPFYIAIVFGCFSPCGLSDGVTCWQNWRSRRWVWALGTWCPHCLVTGSATHVSPLETGLAPSTVGTVFLVPQDWGFGLDFLLFSSFRIALESNRSEWKLLGGCIVWLGSGRKCPSVLVTLLLGPKHGHLHVSKLQLWPSQFNSSSEPNLLQLCWNPGAQWWLESA